MYVVHIAVEMAPIAKVRAHNPGHTLRTLLELSHPGPTDALD